METNEEQATSYPTLEQVEAARAEYDRSEDMCAALVAAAGVTPQELTSERCGDCGDKLDYVAGLDGNGCFPHCWRCWYKDHPVEIPVQVDEAKLADVIAPLMPGAVTEGGATAVGIAHAVAEWLRGGGR